MQPLRSRRPRAPSGSRRHSPPSKVQRPRRPAGPWPPLHALYYDLLLQFVRREGHARVAWDHCEGNFPLGHWVYQRRAGYREGLLTREQIRSLQTLPGWTWSPRDDDFQRGLTALKAFVWREGHARVPQRHREGRLNLGRWVSTRRKDRAHGSLSSDRIRELEALPGWSWSPRDDDFHASLEALRRFAKRQGHARVPFAHREGEIPLGWWVDTQRQFRAHARLSRERARLLERVPGWTWNVPDDLFEDGLRALRSFVRRKGHARVSSTRVERGLRLGVWVANRRSDHSKGTLSSRRVRILEKIPGWAWSLRETSFATGYRLLLRFVEREGHARVPTVHQEAGFPLGRWVHKCRQRQKRLTATRVRRLTSLPGWAWNRFDWQFEEALGLLRAFVEREGHARMPAQHVERGFRLGTWAGRCRSRRFELAKPRRLALEKVRGWAWSLRPQQG